MDKKPFVFISYSRKDYKIAVEIQRKLEKYPYSKLLVEKENYPYDNKYVRPVFLDLTDLSSKARAFTEELRNNLISSKYLIVICTRSSAASEFVSNEIKVFYDSHGGDSSCIIPIIVDAIVPNFNPIIDEIIRTRNCPLYKTEKDATNKLANKYCLYHILEFLLKVDFDKLFNRYLNYTRNRLIRRIGAFGVTMLLIIFALIYGLIKSEEKVEMERRLVQFEKKTFPYSLVIGYVGNFMHPMLKTLVDSCEFEPHVLIFMPSTYKELVHKDRLNMYNSFAERNYPIDSVYREIVQAVGRRREISTVRLKIAGCNIPFYLDNANTVSAFSYVVDYKFRESPTEIKETKDEMVNYYSREFIECTYDSLQAYRNNVHFIMDTIMFQKVVDSLVDIGPQRIVK